MARFRRTSSGPRSVASRSRAPSGPLHLNTTPKTESSLHDREPLGAPVPVGRCDASDVDGPVDAGQCGLHCRQQVGDGEAEVACQQIPGPGRKDPERDARPCEHGQDRADRAVAAAGQDEVHALAQRCSVMPSPGSSAVVSSHNGEPQPAAARRRRRLGRRHRSPLRGHQGPGGSRRGRICRGARGGLR